MQRGLVERYSEEGDIETEYQEYSIVETLDLDGAGIPGVGLERETIWVPMEVNLAQLTIGIALGFQGRKDPVGNE